MHDMQKLGRRHVARGPVVISKPLNDFEMPRRQRRGRAAVLLGLDRLEVGQAMTVSGLAVQTVRQKIREQTTGKTSFKAKLLPDGTVGIWRMT